jgi:tetraprenyl-beta-curcumene synthase
VFHVEDPAPLTASQIRALAAAACRELLWGLRAVRREHQRWLARASSIPDPQLRRHAIAALHDKRPLLDGAALFWIIPDRRRIGLLRLLVAFQILANYHDHASERGGDCRSDPASTMDHFTQVLDLRQTPTHYRPRRDHADGGYLNALVATCREECRRLPGYSIARPQLVLAAERARTLDLEHADAPGRQQGLRTFATDALGSHATLSWFELAAGASSLLTAIVSLALAARDDVSPADLADATEAYTLVATVSALLDNFVDYGDDVASGVHNYLSYYANADEAAGRLAELVALTMNAVGRLPNPGRHRVIVGAMVAMYLTSGAARTADQQHAARLVASGGTLTALLMPVLVGWRTTRREHGA